MTRAHTDTQVHYDRITDPGGSALTARAFVRTVAGDVVDAWWHVGVGPGLGPHEGRDIPTLRRWAWALHHLADALEHATTDGESEPDPQLSLADAPIAAGHHPTIKIGAP